MRRDDPDRPRSALRRAARSTAHVALGTAAAGARVGRKAALAGRQAWDNERVRRVVVLVGVEGVLFVAPRFVPFGPTAVRMMRRVGYAGAGLVLARAEARRREREREEDAGADVPAVPPDG